VCNLKECIIGNPRRRAILNTILTVLIGVSSSILATQVMPNGKFNLALLTHVSGFWILLFLTILWIWVQISFLDYDENILNFADDSHCIAYARKAQLEGLAQTIKKDPSQFNLIKLTDFMKDLEVEKK
jgi:hypothetical protein